MTPTTAEVTPGFKRGDGVVFVGRSTTYYIDRDMEKRSVVTVGTVTSVTRSGQIKEFRAPGYNFSMSPSRIQQTHGATAYRMPKQHWNIEAIMDYCRNRPWADLPECNSMPFDNLAQAREELRQFRIRQES